jgi:hypothetical protein
MKILFFTTIFFYSISVRSQNKIDFPLLIWSDIKQPDYISSYTGPVIFYAPHQDDETLAMGGSIAENIRMGNPVYVVLFGNGGGSKALETLNGKSPCNFHHTTHHFNLSKEEFIQSRNAELIAACKTLGVHRIYIANNGSGWDESIGLINLTKRFKDLIIYFRDQFPNASHNFISGNCDLDPEEPRQISHRAGAIAINNLFVTRFVSKIQLYKVYVYYFTPQQRSANLIKILLFHDILVRQRALKEYQSFKPENKRYAIGYAHSVKSLFDDSYWSMFEYIDYPQNDCQ